MDEFLEIFQKAFEPENLQNFTHFVARPTYQVPYLNEGHTGLVSSLVNDVERGGHEKEDSSFTQFDQTRSAFLLAGRAW